MNIYVDALEPWGTTVGYHGKDAAQAQRVGERNGHMWCHLFADEADCKELHVFARKLGMKWDWFQGDHYDLTPGKRARAVELGAKQLSREETVEVLQRQREARGTLKSPLKWLGGKSWLVPRLRQLYRMHRHRRFVDVFVGGGSAVLGLAPERALLCDANPHLINFYERLRDPSPFTLDMRSEEALYYAYRNCFNQLANTQARWTRTAAELFWYLNRAGFNGVCRFNRKGEFNVPFGQSGRRGTVNFERDFSAYTPLLLKWEIVHTRFENAPIAPDDFLYGDPPYDGDESAFVDYSAGGFDWDAQVRLAKKFAAHPGPVVASNAATDRILDLYRGLGFHVETLSAPRSVAANGDRKDAMEMLATKGIVEGGRLAQ